MSHPSDNDRSLAERALIDTMDHYIGHGTNNEAQLARLCKDLIEMTGAQENVKQYINRKAVEVLDEVPPWL